VHSETGGVMHVDFGCLFDQYPFSMQGRTSWCTQRQGRLMHVDFGWLFDQYPSSMQGRTSWCTRRRGR
jgi:hypothetical protein